MKGFRFVGYRRKGRPQRAQWRKTDSKYPTTNDWELRLDWMQFGSLLLLNLNISSLPILELTNYVHKGTIEKLDINC